MKLCNIWAALAVAGLLVSCSKKNNGNGSSDIIQNIIAVESIIYKAPANDPNNDCDPNRKGFIDLYDGVALSLTEAQNQSSKIDFAYNYHGGGCGTCRFFENVSAMSGRTWYVQSFSTITNSQIIGTYYGKFPMNDKQFDSLKTSADIENYFTKYIPRVSFSDDITNRTDDAIQSRFFAFTDKNKKKGFFKISDYVANPPDYSPTPITLTVKMQK